MGYKTILAVIDTTDNARKLDVFIAALARQFSSHVVGLHMETLAAVPLVAPMEIPDPATVQAVQEVAHKETAEAGQIFIERMAAQGISHEWRSLVSSVGYSSTSSVQSARCADLIIARQTDSSSLSDSRAELDSFLYESGRPILLVPHAMVETKPIKRVMIAWNGSREATRATFDAMPFLLAADSVEVFSVALDDGETAGQSLAGTEIAATLERHGVNVTVTSQEKMQGVSPQSAIEKRLSDGTVDLLVMGAYGHSRWWEMLFGGVTHRLLESMTAMTLLSR